jgi:hypothetical protein
MSADIAAEIWGELKRFINSMDQADAAETLVNVMIDNDIDSEDIRSAFSGDAMVKRILSDYVDEEEDDYDEEEEYEEDE